MDKNSKFKLTGGTLIVIALIVLIFGNARTSDILNKLEESNKNIEKLHKQVNSLENEIRRLSEMSKPESNN